MPTVTAISLSIIWLITIIGTIRSALLLPQFSSKISPLFVIIATILQYTIIVLMTLGVNWARIILSILVVLAFGVQVVGQSIDIKSGVTFPPAKIYGWCSHLAQIVAFACLFLPASNKWYETAKPLLSLFIRK